MLNIIEMTQTSNNASESIHYAVEISGFKDTYLYIFINMPNKTNKPRLAFINL